jgi:hypothetical protein
MFDPLTVQVSKTITPWQRFLLIFRPWRMSVDRSGPFITVTYYKTLRKTGYVLKVVRRRESASKAGDA